jgi:Fe2+ transport system protein FeoA
MLRRTQSFDGGSDAVVRLNVPNLRSGEVAVVERIAAANSAAKRLADLGFIQGARLEMVRPGVPCIVRINETCVGLGRDHQTSIELSVC